MSSRMDIAVLGASKVGTSGAPLWQPVVPVSNDTDDTEGFGECRVYQALGVSSLPYPKDESGFAECLIARDVGGMDAVCVGARDTRSAKIVGNLAFGDTVVHSTGPEQAAQLQLKERRRTAALVTRSSKGETMGLVLDGTSDKLSLTANGAMLTFDEDGGFTLTDSTGSAGIRCANGQLNVFGRVVLGGGLANPAMSLMLGPVTGSPGGPASVPLVAAPGVMIGL